MTDNQNFQYIKKPYSKKIEKNKITGQKLTSTPAKNI